MNFRLTDEPGYWKNAAWETDPGQKPLPAEALAVAGDSRSQPRGHRRTGEKFAIASRHGNIGANSDLEVRHIMAKIVVVYSQPG
jgi:hypothetical protein